MSGLDRFPKKPCKFCGKTGHFPSGCRLNPKKAMKRGSGMKRSRMNKDGKQTKQWFITRATWIRKNPPDENGYWYCYLNIHPWCPRRLTIDTDLVSKEVGLLTIDHIVARTRDYSKRFSQDNLRPACSYCNEMKGSKSLDQVKRDAL